MAEDTAQEHLGKLCTDDSMAKTANNEKCSKSSKQNWQLTLEPALVGAMIAINLGQTSLQNFYLRTACTVDLNFTRDICESGVGPDFESAEKDSQHVVTSINVSRSFIGALISTVVLLFAGPWSDCSGRRKPLLIMPLLGMSIMTSCVLLMITFPGFSTVQVLYAVQIPISIGGNFGLLLAAAFSYIGDVCHATGRDVTRAMGVHRAAIQVAHVIGAISGPHLYRHFGFYGVFPIVFFLQVSSLIFVIVRVEDVNINLNNKVSMLNWRLPLNAVKSLVKKRDGNKRKIVFLMLLIALGDRILLAAEVLLSFMFFRLKFKWDDILFGSFLAYKNIVSFLGTLLILTVLKRRLRLSDELVGALSCLSNIIATSSLIAAKTTIIVFLIPIIGIIAQGSQVVQRPILNKQILPNEQGKIYSIMGALEQACQTISSPLYSLLYANTVSIAPDAWLIPGLFLALLQVVAYLVARKLTKVSDNTKPTKSVIDPETVALHTKEFGSAVPTSIELKSYKIDEKHEEADMTKEDKDKIVTDYTSKETRKEDFNDNDVK